MNGNDKSIDICIECYIIRDLDLSFKVDSILCLSILVPKKKISIR